MARGTLTVQQISTSGLVPSYTAGNSDGHLFANDGNVFIHVKNTNAATRTVTVQTPQTVGGMAIAELTYVVPALTGDVMLGPFDTGIFNQSGGVVNVDLSAAADVTIAAIRLS